MPTTRRSAGISAPPDVMTMPGRNSTARSPKRNSTPCARCRPAKTAPSSGPSWSCSAPGCGSSTVTGQPAERAAAVVSRPIQPAPATTTRGARLERLTQPVGIGDRAQVEHLLPVGAGEVEPARRGAGGEQQLVVGQLRVARGTRGGDGGRAAVDRGDGDAGDAGPRGARRTSRRRARRPSHARRCRAGSPWTAAGARTGAPARSRAARSRRRIPRRAASRRPWPRPGWRRRSQRLACALGYDAPGAQRR